MGFAICAEARLYSEWCMLQRAFCCCLHWEHATTVWFSDSGCKPKQKEHVDDGVTLGPASHLPFATRTLLATFCFMLLVATFSYAVCYTLCYL